MIFSAFQKPVLAFASCLCQLVGSANIIGFANKLSSPKRKIEDVGIAFFKTLAKRHLPPLSGRKATR
jgi:hypothetical protein